MKRFAGLSIAASVAFSTGAQAQLTMQMSNGWSFTFAGNVNAFGIFTRGSVDTAGTIAGGLVPEEKVTRIRTGLLPAFATLEAKGQEAGLDLTVHFGFAPQINSNGFHDNFGAQIGRARQQGFLARPAEVGKQQDPDAIEIAVQRQGIIVGLREGIVRTGMQHGPMIPGIPAL